MIFCKHEYQLYNVSKYYFPLSTISYDCFKFICKKCKKEKILYSADIENEIEYLEDNVRKQIVFGNQLDEYSSKSNFSMKTFTHDIPRYYEGKHIDMLKRKYKKKYNIDLDEISHWYR